MVELIGLIFLLLLLDAPIEWIFIAFIALLLLS